MNILLVYPETPTTFWSFHEALKFVSKKSAEPPLGLITVAAMLPKEWNKKLIDMNVSKLEEEHIAWADYVFISGMNVQLKSFRDVIRKCNNIGTKVVAGGPLATIQHEDFLGVDHFVLNEAEITLPEFLKDLENGNPKRIYSTKEFPEMSLSPVPMWELLDSKKYASLSLQYSRGCPYDCEFCSITMLNGHKPRSKSKEQFINELDILYKSGWRGGVSIVDDNFIGNKRKLKAEILPALAKWSSEKNYPFQFITEVSINLSDDDALLTQLLDAGLNNIFVGIETPNEESLAECGKSINLHRDLVSSVRKLQRKGFIVSGGFIIGFDSDPQNIFEKQINFIQKSGIVTAMVGLLNAPIGTKLFKRLKIEGRLLNNFTGNNMDGSINFIPRMSYQKLIMGYKKVLDSIYSQKNYYERTKKFLTEYNQPKWAAPKIKIKEIKAFFRLILFLGIMEKGKKYFWKLLLLSIFKYPKKFSIAMTLAVYGYHYRRVVETV